jgi:hypothetical protein
MKALFVDEDVTKVTGAMTALERDGWQCTHCTFRDVQEEAKKDFPDLLVLDLMDGGPEDDAQGKAGNDVFKGMLSQAFCPVIVYSANPTLLDNTAAPSPLIALVQKGTGAHGRIKDAATRLLPAIEAVTAVRREVRSALEESLKQFIPRFIGDESGITVTGDAKTYVYLARRRVAAMLDEMTADGGKLQVWEQYLYPALGSLPLLGDLLRVGNGGAADPSAYCLVLTPSCDMDADDGRKPKVDRILVAKCASIANVVAREFRAPSSNKLAEKTERRLNDALVDGYGESAIPLPGIPGAFPDMCADLKTLELLDYSADGKSISVRRGGKVVTFRRIASVDSPFREQVAWNYQRIACRPGMPDRDIGKWAETVAKLLQAQTEVRKT